MHRSLIYEEIKCFGLGLAMAVDLRDTPAEIKHERQTLRTTTSSHGKLMNYKTVHAVDGLIGKTDTWDLKVFMSYVFEWVTRGQIKTI